MVPVIKGTRFIRTYAGIRPLVLPEEKEDDRAISRGFALIDHEKRDGFKNLITVTGGKLITYRLMAERTSDLLCQKMGIQASCSTHSIPLSGKGKPFELKERLKEIRPALGKSGEIICDCEIVEREELEESLKKGDLKDLQDILHRTRLAKGTCQGGFCIYRLLGVLHDLKMSRGDSNSILKGFLEERWKGIRPILWGTTLKEEELIESIYKGIFNL
jgi:glycerol-3-phosphate dehydrogenase